MGLSEWVLTLIGAAGFLFGFYKWVIARSDKHEGEIRAAKDKLRDTEREANKSTLDDHDKRLDRHAERMGKMEELINLTRKEMLENYITLSHLRRLEDSLKEQLTGMFGRLNKMNSDLNKAIGTMQGKHESEIKGLIEEISKALNNGQPQK